MPIVNCVLIRVFLDVTVGVTFGEGRFLTFYPDGESAPEKSGRFGGFTLEGLGLFDDGDGAGVTGLDAGGTGERGDRGREGVYRFGKV